MCAGMNMASSHSSMTISRRSLLSKPRIGLPSEWMLPMASSLCDMASASSMLGSNIRLWTFLVFPSFLYMELISPVTIKRGLLKLPAATRSSSKTRSFFNT